VQKKIAGQSWAWQKRKTYATLKTSGQHSTDGGSQASKRKERKGGRVTTSCLEELSSPGPGKSEENRRVTPAGCEAADVKKELKRGLDKAHCGRRRVRSF